MKALEQFKISVYKTNYSTDNVETHLINIIRAIIKGEWKEKVNAIRRYMNEGDETAANRLKADLPCFTVSGVFKGGHAVKNLVEPTGLVILDFDDVAQLETLRAICNADPHTVASFRSPKDGFKVIVYVENATGRHKEAYALVCRHYQQITGLEIDESGKDLSRTCLMSYDPEGYIAALYDSFVLPDAPQAPYTSEDTLPAAGANSGEESFAGREKDFIKSNLFLYPLHQGDRNQGAFRLGCRAAKASCGFSATYSALAERICDATFTKEELKRSLQSAYQHVASQTTSSEIRSEKETKNADSAIPPFRHYECFANGEEEEEEYKQGEEYRKKTPYIPEKVYENIPTIISQCLAQDLPQRHRDVGLLAATVIFSALMPSTWANYNHSRFSPHLYGWVIAPPASGKKTADDISHLLDATDDMIQAKSDAAQEKYEKEKMEYDAACRRKKKEDEQAPQRPQEPPYKSLVIPANISNTHLIIRLRDNGLTGGIIFDSEAKTLSDSNKQDYGHLDSILCKATAHETVSNNYIVHGKKPISCRRPLLAMMLTSTTIQVEEVAGPAGSGLMSRILAYTYNEIPKWKEMGNNEGYDIIEHFEKLSQQACKLFCFCEAHPVVFNFTGAQWKIFNDTFSQLLESSYLEDHEELQATVKRYAFSVMRVAMIYTRLRQFEMNDTETVKLECPDCFFQSAMDLVLTCYEHCRLLLSPRNKSHASILRNPERNVFPLDQLSKRFTYSEAIAVAVSCGMSKRTAERIFSRLIGLKIKKVSKGNYEKVECKAP